MKHQSLDQIVTDIDTLTAFVIGSEFSVAPAASIVRESADSEKLMRCIDAMLSFAFHTQCCRRLHPGEREALKAAKRLDDNIHFIDAHTAIIRARLVA